jgi:predicted transcriptional regulator of viral defense system
MGSREAELINFLKKKGGLASYAEILEAGFNKILLKPSLNSKRINKIDRGLYRLSGGDALSHPDLIAVSIRIPNGVVCLVSALSFHGATKEIPQHVDIAIPRGSNANKIQYPPVKYYRFDSKAWEAGIEEHKIGGHRIMVYNLARTVADCFKFRNKVGVDVAREALKIAVSENKIKPKEIMRYSQICHVDRIIKPILEAML